MASLYYSILHFFVDGVCAIAMARFAAQEGGYTAILFYNFCAFVLQMPIGVAIDTLTGGRVKKSALFAAAGAAVTVAGAFLSPVVLGIGNAMFHVGGGVGTIEEDRVRGSLGRRLGVFVAPGAMGLFLGRLIGKGFAHPALWILGAAVLMGLLLVPVLRMAYAAAAGAENPQPAEENPKAAVDFAGGEEANREEADRAKTVSALIVAGSFFVVILRSYAGFAVGMPWRSTVAAGIAATAMVVLGKMAGGFAAASFGRMKTVCASLLGAAVCYAFCGWMPAGLLALFLFNMTMPVTLQLLVERFPDLPGTMFGLLTVALFVGFIPIYEDLPAPFLLPAPWIGVLSSLISAAVLAVLSVMAADRERTQRGR